jgi:hypothetical protein
VTDWSNWNPESELITAVQRNIDVNSRVRLVTSLNPLLRNDPQTAMRMASMPITTDQLGNNSFALYGMMAADRVRSNIESMTPSMQRAVWSRLPRAQQMALTQQGYQAQTVDEYGFTDMLGDALKLPFQVVAAPLKGLGQITKPVWQPALEGLAWLGDQPAHVYRAIRTMDDGQQWAGLAGALLGIGAAAATIATGGAALGFFAAAGTLGAAGLAGATAGSILADPLNPMDFGRAWMDTRDGERAFDRAASRYAESVLGDPRLKTLATEIADVSDRSIYEIAREVAGARETSAEQRSSSYLGELARIADSIAQPDSPQHQRVMESLSRLLTEPTFLEAVNRLQQGKISIGRDIADALPWIEKDSAIYTMISGGADALFQIAVDPFLIAGRVSEMAKFHRMGLEVIDDGFSIDRFMDIAENVPSVKRLHGKLAEAVMTDDYEMARRLGTDNVSLWEGLRTYRENLIRENVVTPTEFGAEHIRSYIRDVKDMKSILSGIGTYRGKERLMLKGFNYRNEAWARTAGGVRSFTSGLTDIRPERQMLKEMEASGVNRVMEGLPAHLRLHRPVQEDIPFLQAVANNTEYLTPGVTGWQQLADEPGRLNDMMFDFANRLYKHDLLPDDDIQFLDDLQLQIAEFGRPLQRKTAEFSAITDRLSEIAKRALALPMEERAASMLDEYALYKELNPRARQIGRGIAKVLPRASHAVGTTMQMATTMISPQKAIQLVGEGAPENIRQFTEQLRLTGMPEYMRRMWFDEIIKNPTGHARGAAMLTALDNGLTIAGMRSLKGGEEFVDKFLLHAQHAYGLGGTVDRTIINGRRMITSPLLDDSAKFLMMPNLTDLRKLTRAGFVSQVMGITDIKVLDSFINQVWKPAVLLRFAFIPRAGGEEWINFMLRGGFGSIAENMGGQYVGRYRAWRDVIDKVEKLGAAKVGKGALTAEEALLYQQGPLPKIMRPVERMLNRYEWTAPMTRRMKDFAEDLQYFLTPESMQVTLRTGEEVAGRGGLGWQAGIDRMLNRIGGDARVQLSEGASEMQLRRAMTREGRFAKFVPTSEKAWFNIADYADTLLMGSPSSWRRLVAGGVNDYTIEAGEQFAKAFQTILMREVSATEAGNFERGYNRSDVKTLEVADGQGGTKTVRALAMRGGWKRHERAIGDPLFNFAAHQGVLNTIALDEGGRRVATEVLSRVLPSSMNYDDAAAFLDNAARIDDELIRELVLGFSANDSRIARVTLEAVARQDQFWVLVKNRLPEAGPITMNDVRQVTDGVLNQYTEVINGSRAWRRDMPDDVKNEIYGYTRTGTIDPNEEAGVFVPSLPPMFKTVDQFVSDDVREAMLGIEDGLAAAMRRSIDDHDFQRQLVNHLYTSPQTLYGPNSGDAYRRAARIKRDEARKAIKAERAEALPPVPKGYVRFYRGDYAEGGRVAGPSTNPEWLASQPEMITRGRIQGRFVTEDLEYAKKYPMNMDPDEVGVVRYVDVPSDVAKRIRGLRDQADDVRALSKSPDAEAILPDEYVGQLKDMPSESTLAAFDQRMAALDAEQALADEARRLAVEQGDVRTYRLYANIDEADADVRALLNGHFENTTVQERAALSFQSPVGPNHAEYDNVTAFLPDAALVIPDEAVRTVWESLPPFSEGVQDRWAGDVADVLVSELARAAGLGDASQILQHRSQLVSMYLEQMEMKMRRGERFFGMEVMDELNPATSTGLAVRGRFNGGTPGENLPDLDMLFADQALVKELNLAMKNLMSRHGKLAPEVPEVFAVRLPRAITDNRSTSVMSPLAMRMQIRSATRDENMIDDLAQMRISAGNVREPLTSEVRPIAVRPGTDQPAIWTAYRKVIKERRRLASDLQNPDAAEEYADRMWTHIKQMTGKKARETHRARFDDRIERAEDGTESVVPKSRVYRYGKDNKEIIEVKPGEELFPESTFVDSRGNVVKYGDGLFMEPLKVTYEPNDLMWQLIGPMIEDSFDGIRGVLRHERKAEMMMVRGRLEPSPDWTPVYRSKDSHVPDEAHGGPQFAIGPQLEPIKENTWQKIVRYGFDQVIGPAIDAIVRRPMAFHFFAQRYRFAKQANGWMIDPELAGRAMQGLEYALHSRTVVAPERIEEVSDLVKRMATLDGHGAERWTSKQAMAWLRSFDEGDLAPMLRRVKESIETRLIGLDDASQVSQRLRNTSIDITRLENELMQGVKVYSAMPDIIRNERIGQGLAEIARSANVERDLLAEMERLLPVGALYDPERLLRSWNKYAKDQIRAGTNSSANYLDYTQAQAITAHAKEVRNASDAAGNLAAEAALRDIMPFIDSQKVRTQFAEYGRGLLPFWYAEENFLKRWGRTILDDPTVIRKAQLTYMGLRTAGIIRQDEQGKDWFVYPGSGLLAETVSKLIPGASVQAIGTMFQSPTSAMFPGLSERFGTPSFSPFVSVPMDLVTWMFNDLAPIERAMLGDYAANRNALEHLIPASLTNLWDGVMQGGLGRVDETNVRYASALFSAMAYLDATGDGIPANANAQVRDEFLRRVRGHARVILASQAFAGFFTPGPPQALISGETGGFSGVGAQDPRDILNSQYQELIRELGIDEGTIKFLELNQNANLFDIVNPMALTVGKTESASGVSLPTTEEAVQFYTEHADYLATMPMAGPWLLPVAKKGDERSQYAYDQQLIEGLRRKLTPDEFLSELKYKEAAPRYFALRKKYLDAVDRLKMEGNEAGVEVANQWWQSTSTAYRAAHPIFDEQMSSSDGRQRRAAVIEEMRTAVYDPLVPPSPQLEGFREIMTTWDQYKIALATLREDGSARGRVKVEQAKATFEKMMDDLMVRRPEMRSFYLAIIRPEADLD